MADETIKSDSFEITIYGKPETKGSTKGFHNKYTGNVSITNTNKNCKTWQTLVSQSISDVWGDKKLVNSEVGLHLYFILPKPKNYPKTKELQHIKKPDLDKLIRPILDSLTNVIICDDSQVGFIMAQKRYGDKPCCKIIMTVFNR